MQREVLTIRKNIPRNSARNSLKMSRLRPSFSFIFLLYSFSIFPCGFLLDVFLVTQQTANSSDGFSVKHWRCRLSPPTRCARTAQADSDVKLSQSVSLGDHKRSTSTSTGFFFSAAFTEFSNLTWSCKNKKWNASCAQHQEHQRTFFNTAKPMWHHLPTTWTVTKL